MYAAKVREQRRCKATRKDGMPCERFACWGDTQCGAHGGKGRGAAVCRCRAYNWPHRPAGGLCRWPDPPTHRRTTPAGTHAWPGKYRPRGSSKFAEMFGAGQPTHLAAANERRARR